MPCTHSGSTSASCTGVSRRAVRSKPMISSASWRNRVSTRCESASAVCFIGPQRPSVTIENDRSTQTATAAVVRRSVSTTSKSSTSSRPGMPAPRRSALDTVRTASIGQLVAEHPRPRACRPARRPTRCGGPGGRPLPAASICENTRFSALSPSRRTARGVSRSPSSPRDTKPCRSSSRSSSRSARKSAAAPAPRCFSSVVHVDVVEGRARVRPGPATAPAPPGRRARRPPRRRRCSPATRRPRACSTGPRFIPGRSARRLSESCAICEARSGSDIASLISWPSCSRCSGDSDAIIRSAGGLPAGERVDQLVDVLGVLREQVAVLVHELAEPVLGVLAAGVRGEQLVEVREHVLDGLHRGGVRVVQRLLQAGELRVEHLALQHLLDRLVRRPGLVASASRSRPAPAPPRPCRRGGWRAPSPPSGRRRRPRRRGCRAPAASAWSSAARTWSSVPPRSPRRRAALRIRRTRAASSSRPAVAVEPAPQQVRAAPRAASRRRARRGRRSSSAARTSYGGASGSGPSCQGP